MIARVWRGRVPAEHAEGFALHLAETGIAESAAVSGNLGAEVWRREAGGWAHFVLVTYWADEGAVRRFAGEDPGRAVLYPGDERYGLVPDVAVEHWACSRRTARLSSALSR